MNPSVFIENYLSITVFHESPLLHHPFDNAPPVFKSDTASRHLPLFNLITEWELTHLYLLR